MEITKRIIFLFVFIVALVFPSQGSCQWVGPKQVVSLKFGNGNAEVGKETNYPWTRTPEWIGMDDSGNIIINDEVNKKILIQKLDGKSTIISISTLDELTCEWPGRLYVVGNDKFISECGSDYSIYKYT